MRWWLIGLVIVAAVASAFHLFLMMVGHMMDPRWGSQGDHVLSVALGVVALLTVGGLVLTIRRASTPWAVGAAVMILAAGSAPLIYEAQWRSEIRAEHAARLGALEARTLAQIETRRQDVEARIVEQRPYQGEDARLFMVFVTDADNARAGGTNHSPQSIALMQRALEAKILDPNTIVKQPVRADRGPEPLFLNFYRNVRQRPDQSLLSRDWKILKILAASGADLSAQGAEAFAGDLRKAETPLYGGLYVELK